MAILRRAIDTDQVPQSYLFHGPDGVGKFAAALYFGMAINCHAAPGLRPCGECNSCKKFMALSHPDLIYHFPSPNLEFTPEGESRSKNREKLLKEYAEYVENRRTTPWREYRFSANSEIRIDVIRWLEHRVNVSLHEGRYKVVIVEAADQMNASAANAFLKTLEEPPANTVLILTTARPDAMLPTILSRCQRVAFRALPRHIIEEELTRNPALEPLAVKTYARIANGNMQLALQLAETGDLETREDVLEFLEIVVSQDDLAFLAFLRQKFGTKAQAALLEFLTHLLVVVADIGLYKNLPSEIANIDQTRLFDMCYRRNMAIDEDIADMMNTIEAVRRRVEGNVSPQLALIRLYQYLGREFGFRRE